jgi:AcrR family transcriptional regulator
LTAAGKNKMGAGRRPYRKRKRAVAELQTRQRITEAAVALHQTIGPAHTSVKAIAERAGVERATVYRHFPTEEALFDACTSHYYARHPMPDPRTWAVIAEPGERLRAALSAFYAWYEETEDMLSPGIRDLERVPAGAREAFLGYFAAAHATLMRGRAERGRPRALVSAAIGHAINFLTWRSLVREPQLAAEEGVALMVAMVQAAAQPRSTGAAHVRRTPRLVSARSVSRSGARKDK